MLDLPSLLPFLAAVRAKQPGAVHALHDLLAEQGATTADVVRLYAEPPQPKSCRSYSVHSEPMDVEYKFTVASGSRDADGDVVETSGVNRITLRPGPDTPPLIGFANGQVTFEGASISQPALADDSLRDLLALWEEGEGMRQALEAGPRLPEEVRLVGFPGAADAAEWKCYGFVPEHCRHGMRLYCPCGLQQAAGVWEPPNVATVTSWAVDLQPRDYQDAVGRTRYYFGQCPGCNAVHWAVEDNRAERCRERARKIRAWRCVERYEGRPDRDFYVCDDGFPHGEVFHETDARRHLKRRVLRLFDSDGFTYPQACPMGCTPNTKKQWDAATCSECGASGVVQRKPSDLVLRRGLRAEQVTEMMQLLVTYNEAWAQMQDAILDCFGVPRHILEGNPAALQPLGIIQAPSGRGRPYTVNLAALPATNPPALTGTVAAQSKRLLTRGVNPPVTRPVRR